MIGMLVCARLGMFLELNYDHNHSYACSQVVDNWRLLHNLAEAWLQECVKAQVVPIYKLTKLSNLNLHYTYTQL